MIKKQATIDGNTAAAYISYAFTELAAIYPITPSSTMAELVDLWSSEGKKNIFGQPVEVVEMQSEAGAAGTAHGSLQTGVLTSTYTSSQGLLLMLPNMYKIAGELLPSVFHVASRTIATSALSIFGDHSDVMAARQTGFVMLASSSVQEVHDLSAVAHLATLEAELPFLHFFDGFRTSHEVQKINLLSYETLSQYIDQEALARFRQRGLHPNRPKVTGTSQNADIHFQQKEASNRYYQRVPEYIQKYMNVINELQGTDYQLVNYYGHPEATEVIVSIGSVAGTIHQVVDALNEQGRQVGHINIHLYRPFPSEALLDAIPNTVEKIAVLDRTKEPGTSGEPLFLDVQHAFYQSSIHPVIIGGRYGLSSKDVTPAQIMAIYHYLQTQESFDTREFTIGIQDDVTHLSLPLPVKADYDLTDEASFQALFWGFGSDGTVGATKAVLELIGTETSDYVQGYFEYDSKKSGSLTRSHVRISPKPIESTYLIQQADLVACHHTSYVYQYDLLEHLKPGGIFLLNTSWTQEQLKDKLPQKMMKTLLEKKAHLYIIDAFSIAQEVGLGRHINMIMEAAFLELSHLLPEDQIIPLLEQQIHRMYHKKSDQIIQSNIQGLYQATEKLIEVSLDDSWLTSEKRSSKSSSSEVPAFVMNIVEPIARQKGDELTVSDLIQNGMVDGSIPLGTSAYEKRGIALEVPEWIEDRCTMCNECAFVCPHAAIRPFLATEEELEDAPEGFITREMRGADGLMYRIQVSLEDCTGCGLCVDVCPAKGKALVMKPYEDQKEEAINWAFAMTLSTKVNPMKKNSVRGSQFEQPLLEFSGACSGCGETPYLKLLTQLYGDRLMIANATGCSSIYGASAPTTPYTTNDQGQGPAWSNSLFEDNAEYGYGMYLAQQTKRKALYQQVQDYLASTDYTTEVEMLLKDWADHWLESEGTQQRAQKVIAALQEEVDQNLMYQVFLNHQDEFVKPSQWIIGGDGWAYDIGFGGIDHVIASGADVNILVMDNEVYANTGGQLSKATPKAAVAKFAAQGKVGRKKDLGRIAMTYENVYVAQIASGASPIQTIKAFEEAEKYPGPSIIIAYTPCIAHGLEGGLGASLQEAKDAVSSGYWPIYRYQPWRRAEGKPALILDEKRPDFSKIKDFLDKQNRFAVLAKMKRISVDKLYQELIEESIERFFTYAEMAGEAEKIRKRMEKNAQRDRHEVTDEAKEPRERVRRKR